ncbi:tetratricopeptide repeat protein [Kitasatospora sp. HPMI-4]|uniref:tetratricopeptide repeat protein n=1 Tax=Kitasatospora sp. HPMI-4 TaxID=3448443 RepID=UPI003F1C059B
MGIFGRRKKRQEQERGAAEGIDLGGGTRLVLDASPAEIRQLTQQFRAGAEGGDAGSMERLAMFLEYQGNLAEAIEWRERAAGLGEVDAATWLADRLLKQNKHAEAVEYLRIAARGGHISCAYNLGMILATSNQPEEAAKWLLRAAEAGHEGAGKALNTDAGRIRAMREAVAQAVARAEQGDAAAAHEAAIGYLELLEEEPAEHWMAVGAERGNADCAWELALRERERGARARSLELLRIAAGGGHARAAAIEGLWLLADGDEEGAEASLRPLADAGNWVARYNLLAVIQHRAGVQPGAPSGMTDEMWELLDRAWVGARQAVAPLIEAGNWEEAESLLRIPAEGGDPAAQEALAEVLLSSGDPRRAPEAEALRRRAQALRGARPAAKPSGRGASGRDAALPMFSAEQGRDFRDLVRESFASYDVTVTVRGEVATDTQGRQFGLSELARACAERPGGRAEWPDEVNLQVGQLLMAFSGPLGVERLSRDELLPALYPMLVADETLPETYERAGEGIGPEVLPGLREQIALNSREGVHTLSAEGIAGLGEIGQVRARARANLVASMGVDEYEVLQHPGGGVFHVITGSTPFIASLVLVLEDLVRATTGQPIPPDGALVAMPARHQLLFHPIRDVTVLTAMDGIARYAEATHARSTGALSPDVHWWRDGRLTTLTGRDGDGFVLWDEDGEFTAMLERLDQVNRKPRG